MPSVILELFSIGKALIYCDVLDPYLSNEHCYSLLCIVCLFDVRFDFCVEVCTKLWDSSWNLLAGRVSFSFFESDKIVFGQLDW